MILFQWGRRREALELVEPWLTREPDHLPPRVVAGMAHTLLGDPERGLSLMNRAVEIVGPQATVEMGRALALKMLGRDDEVAEIASSLLARSKHEYVVPTALAGALSLSGDVDGALDHLERALEERVVTLPGIGIATARMLWTPLYPHPRFQAVFKAVFPGRELPTA